jgi:hypothetical protein
MNDRVVGVVDRVLRHLESEFEKMNYGPFGIVLPPEDAALLDEVYGPFPKRTLRHRILKIQNVRSVR